MSNKGILTEASAHVETYFRTRKPDWAVYHNLRHTKDVVKACREIGSGVHLSEEEIEIVTLAAWFHDIGYLEDTKNHEQRGIELTTRFLHEKAYPPDKISKVVACIRATKLPQEPTNLMEQVLCDADLAHLASENFLEITKLVRLEQELRQGRKFSDLEWLEANVRFLSGQRYHTGYARARFAAQHAINAAALRTQLDLAERQRADRSS